MEKKLVVSIHDFSSKYYSELEEILSELDSKGVSKRSILCIPAHETKHQIEKDNKTVGLLQKEYSNGNEICVHGFDHCKEGMDKMFLKGNYLGVRVAMLTSKKKLESIGIVAEGFVPAYWKIHPEALKAIKDYKDELGMGFVALNPYLIDLNNDLTYSSRPIWAWPFNRALDYGFRIFNKGLKEKLKNNDLIRVAIHPHDVWKARPLEHLLKIIDDVKRGRDMISYKKYLDLKYEKSIQ